MTKQEITLSAMHSARETIAPLVRYTPIIASPALTNDPDVKVVLKLENLQVTGSFKVRGAANKVLNLTDQERTAGIITVSSGNHGRAISYVANRLGIPAAICISDAVPINKREAIESLGAELKVGGTTYDEAAALAERLMVERGMTMVHPYDESYVIEGQGTIGLELLNDFPEIDTVLVPLSGGGLLSGIAFALKTTNPSIRIIGISMERGPAMVESLQAGRIVEITEEPTLADALAGGLGSSNAYTFEMIQQYVDETILVSEGEIAEAITFALDEHCIVVEGGGAVGIAALLAGKVDQLGRNVAVVISGGNIDLSLLQNVAQGRAPLSEESAGNS
ncbi:MAG: threonine/serine dehydratase [Anaerolineales bacterium]